MGSIKKVDFSPTKDWARGLVALHDGAMIIYQTDPLFAWNRLDDSPDLKSIKLFFERLPDAALLEALQQWRGGSQRREVGRLGQTKLSSIAKALTRS